MHRKLKLFYSSLSFLYVSDMGAMIGIIWASFDITKNPLFLGCLLCISSIFPYLFKKIFSLNAVSLKQLFIIRVAIYAFLLLLSLSTYFESIYGLILTILLFGIINVLTLTVYETHNSYAVGNRYISSDMASRIMQTVLQVGAFFGAVIAGYLLSNFGYTSLMKIIAVYEIWANTLFLFLKIGQIFSYQQKPKHTSIPFTEKRDTQLIYLLCIPLGAIGLHITSFNILSTVIFQDINHWSSALFGYASGFAGVGAFLASLFPFRKITLVLYSIILIGMDIIYSNTAYPLLAIGTCFFIGYSINFIRISIRTILLDLSSLNEGLSQRMGEFSAMFYTLCQALGSIVIGGLISKTMAGIEIAPLLFPVIGIIVFITVAGGSLLIRNKL